jgi:RNA polymerase sigma-70 factor (ECF subfamily)
MPAVMIQAARMTRYIPRDEPEKGVEPDLACLIEKVRAGDTRAFDEIVRCCQRRVLATAWRMLGSKEDARDAAQEVFLRVFRHLDSFDRRGNFNGWIYRIVTNVCRDMWRIQRRQSAGSLPDISENAELAEASIHDNVESTAIRAQQQALLAKAIAALPEKQRAAIVLRDLEGQSTEEVARILGTSAATVRSQVCLARARLKYYYDRHIREGKKGI